MPHGFGQFRIILVALILVAVVAAVSLVPRAVAEEKAAGIQNAAAKPKGDGSDSKKVADLKIRSTTTMPVELSEAETKCLRGRRAIASGEFIIDEHGRDQHVVYHRTRHIYLMDKMIRRG